MMKKKTKSETISFILTLTHVTLFLLLFLVGFTFAYEAYYSMLYLLVLSFANAFLNDKLWNMLFYKKIKERKE